MRGQRFRAGFRSVDHHNTLKAARNQRVDDRAGGAARANDDGASLLSSPARRGLVQVGEKAGDIRIVTPKAAVLSPEGVDSSESLGDLRPAVACIESRLLVGRGDVRAKKSVLADLANKLTEFFRSDGEPLVASRNI